ncbi:collagen alpha-1(I) chain-like [Lutra lutra]|uniref:collagen alpha-1(I) chain-like n=1 Tax=Lutra lutra TaxID=9657 RepID=UPI001FD4B7D8|nr:collagen alpha-1(I) chain-like [Lutra lutra]
MWTKSDAPNFPVAWVWGTSTPACRDASGQLTVCSAPAGFPGQELPGAECGLDTQRGRCGVTQRLPPPRPASAPQAGVPAGPKELSAEGGRAGQDAVGAGKQLTAAPPPRLGRRPGPGRGRAPGLEGPRLAWRVRAWPGGSAPGLEGARLAWRVRAWPGGSGSDRAARETPAGRVGAGSSRGGQVLPSGGRSGNRAGPEGQGRRSPSRREEGARRAVLARGGAVRRGPSSEE